MKFNSEFLKSFNFDDDHFYNLTLGGYLDPSDALVDQTEAKKIKDAADLVQSFIEQLCEQAEAAQDGEK